MKVTWFDESKNTLYIRTEAIMPDTKGMSFSEHCDLRDRAFKMSYDERIRKFASADDAREIQKEIQKHNGCKISEFSSL